MAKKPAAEAPDLDERYGLPDVGAILKRLRQGRGLSLKEVADATGVSPSFLSQVERGVSDIALVRLARLASFFGHDVGSLLGYTTRGANLHFVDEGDHLRIERGRGITYDVWRVPGAELQLALAVLEPGTGFDEAMTHEGVDVLLVLKGEIVATVGDTDTVVKAGQCVLWSAAYSHRIRNDGKVSAMVVGVITDRIY